MVQVRSLGHGNDLPGIHCREILPFDCLRAVPVPKPVGGTLVFAVNSLFYLNQGIPIYGVSLNATGDKDVATDILIRPLEGAKVSLDCAVAEFLSPDQLVISLKGGELYVLSLLVDSLRAVKGFHLDKAAASVLTTSISLATPGFLFLGSRLGNSLLLKFTCRELGQLGMRREREPPTKRKRLDVQGDWLDTELDEFEVYGSQETAASKISSYSFEVCDSLQNIGPCGQVAMGEPAFLSEEFSSSSPDPDIELVTTSGHGKNGALCLLQKTVRPQVVTTFELPGCQDMWTVCSSSDNDSSTREEEHAFLLLSRRESSMVLQTGQEINELDSSGFCTTSATVFAGNLGDNQYIVQVMPESVRLLKHTELLQTVQLHALLDSSPIQAACVSDPHLAVLSQDGDCAVLTLQGNELIVTKVRVGEMPGRVKSPMVCLSLYRDISGLLTKENRMVKDRERPTHRQVSAARQQEVDEEEELLYGSSSNDRLGDLLAGDNEKKGDDDEEEGEGWQRHLRIAPPTYWLVTVRANGNLELYSVPDFTLR